MTQEEREASARKLRRYIVKASAYLPDEDALEAVQLFSPWKPDTEYETGQRVQDGGILYKCRQPHTSQAVYPPHIVPALWEVVTLSSGTADDVIAYSPGMALEADKLYSDGGVTYICTRSSGIPLHNPLSALVGHYVEVRDK